VVEGLEALVSEELLDVVEVGVALDHLAGAGPPEGGEGRQLKQEHQQLENLIVEFVDVDPPHSFCPMSS
jgi:hypothetical protein